MSDQKASAEPGLSTRLQRARLSVATAMVVERGWPLVLPILIVVSLFLSLSWFGLFRLMPEAVRLGVVAVLALAALAALYPLRYFRKPTAAEIDRRIEHANRLEHTPVLAQTDRPSGQPGAFAQALWHEHQRRMAGSLSGLAGDMPRARVPERDPWGLRAVAALLLVTAFAFSFGPLGGRITDGFTAPPEAAPLPPRIDAWVTPPAYTGKAPVFLAVDATAPQPVVSVPEGSELSLRVTGGSGEETLVFRDSSGAERDIEPAGVGADAAAAPDKPADAVSAGPTTVRQFKTQLTADGTVALMAGEQAIRDWGFTVIPDKPPVIKFAAEPKRAVNGALELAYTIEDDYGPASAVAEFELVDRQAPGARALYGEPEMKLTLPRRGAQDKAAKTSRDLTEHVWAGKQVKLTLKATDGAGQEAHSEVKTFTLPERPFTNPLAKAVVEHRQILALDANRKPWVLELIEAITLRPEDTIANAAHFIGLMTGRTKLVMADTNEQLREVADYFWEMALSIEDGDLSAAERRLRQAQEALKQALENGASDEEIDKLMRELREAMNEFLREFAERAQKNPNLSQQMPQNGQEMRQSDLERMLDQIENLAKSGNRDQAQELLSQLQNMMNNLQAGRQRGQQGEQNSEMRRQMDKLGEIMRRQQEMMNETFRLDQMQRDQRQRGQDRGEQLGEQGQQGQPGQPGEGQQGRPMTPEEFAEALKQLQEGQGQLQGELDSLMKGLEGMGIQPGEGFGEAGQEMGKAEGSLGQGEGDRAVGHQGRALEALRRGAQNMMDQMRQAMEGDEGGGDEGGRQQNADRDPLGRPRATTGPDFGDSVKVPDEIDVQRARQILEAIRKRLGNALGPELERSYLERLLELK